ncbi:uncharacterized protein LOC115727416 [Rhodamnia argentea]|uniref:Uncharacterized protein LOC115727416 n=1 Tax=Rhodamnia argentea TaxID=178133 RepID=A0A8B8MTW4_9MYRT|nr:uncharacterized protein LOC115727416 [Rhodamnia argentea]
MVDLQVVCCMCGDVGFPDKLFRCSKCRNRFQHSYCSSYYGEISEPIAQCDWCQSEQRSARTHGVPSRRSGAANVNTGGPKSEYSGDRMIKQHDGEDGTAPAAAAATDKGKNPSPRTATRRYKLLKDVMC